MQPLHNEISNIAKDIPAAYFYSEVLRSLLLSRIANVVNGLSGLPVPAGSQVLSGILSTATFTGAATVHTTDLGGAPSLVEMAFDDDFVVEIAITPTATPGDVISNVKLTVSSITTTLSAGSDKVTASDFTYAQVVTITRTPNADAIILAQVIEPIEAARVEGLIAYGSAPNALAQIFSNHPGLSLTELFPAIQFQGRLDLRRLDSGRAIGVFPVSMKLNATEICECADFPEVTTQQGSGVATGAAPPAEFGEISVGGPTVPAAKNLGPRSNGVGSLGLYLPESTYREMSFKAMPGIVITAQDNGVIGWDARASVGFKNFDIQLEPAEGGLLFSMELDIAVNVLVTMDLGCGRFVSGASYCIPQGNSTVKIGLYPALDGSGRIVLTPVLKEVSISKFLCLTVGPGALLDLMGAAWYVGVVIDLVLAAIISNNLPIALRKAVVEKMAQAAWPLIDSLPWRTATGINAAGIAAGYDLSSVAQNSLLVSVVSG